MKKYTPELKLFLISLCAGLLFATGMVVVTRVQGIDVVSLTGDAGGYMQLAEHLLTYKTFGLSEHGRMYLESFRAPGYPAFLSLFFALFHNWLAVLLVHAMVMSVAPVLLYMLFKHLHERAAWWGSIIFALEPTRLFLSASLLSDALFTCLFLGSLVLLEWGRRQHIGMPFVYAGVVLGVSILVRPIAMFLPAVYAAYILVVHKPLSDALRGAILIVLATAVVVFPWMLRNHQAFNSWSISSVGSANLMLYNAPAYVRDHPSEQGEAVLEEFQAQQKQLPREEALSLSRSAVFTDTFREVIRGHEISYMIFHITKTIPFFVTDGLREIVRVCGIALSTPPNISSLLFARDIHTIATYMRHGGTAALLLVLGSGFFTVVFLSFLYAGAQILRGTLYTRSALFLMALVFYFALLTGPVSNARYRNPVVGIMIVFALSIYLRDRPQEAGHV